MTPFAEAMVRANEIARTPYSSMFVTMSWGGEYTDSVDVDADATVEVVRPVATTKETVAAIQKKLNELGAKPQLTVDGIMGKNTLNAIRAALEKVK